MNAGPFHFDHPSARDDDDICFIQSPGQGLCMWEGAWVTARPLTEEPRLLGKATV